MDYPVNAFDNASEWIQKYSESLYEDSEMDPTEYKSKAEACLEKVGYSNYCPGGMYRRVYENENTVVKIAIGNQGVKENAAEIRNSTRICNCEFEDIINGGNCNGKMYIADILEYDVGTNYWILMEKATVTPNNVSSQTAEKVSSAFKSKGIHIDELKPYNMGRIDEYPVVFDYGGT